MKRLWRRRSGGAVAGLAALTALAAMAEPGVNTTPGWGEERKRPTAAAEGGCVYSCQDYRANDRLCIGTRQYRCAGGAWHATPEVCAAPPQPLSIR